MKKLNKEKISFTSFNEAQTYYLQSLNKAFAEYYIFSCFNDKLKTIKESSTKLLLQRMRRLYILKVLNDDAVCVRKDDFVSSELIYEIKDEILTLCNILKNDLIAILDVIAPPDHILNSPMGHSDGQIYRRYLKELLELKENNKLELKKYLK